MRITLSVNEVAEYIGVSPWWVYEQVKKKLLPHAKIAGKIFFTKETIDRFLSEQEQKSIEPKQPERLIKRAK